MNKEKELEEQRHRNTKLNDSNNHLRELLADQHQQQAAAALAAESKKSPYEDWAQLNLSDVSIDALLGCGTAAVRVFLWLVKEMDQHNALTCSNTVIQEALGISPATVTRSIRELKAHNVLKIYQAGTAHVFALNHEIVWKSYGKNVWQSKFTSLVRLSKAEQERAEKTGVVVEKHPPKRSAYPASKVLNKNEEGTEE